MRALTAIALALALCGAANGAAAQDDEVQKVPVNGIKNPEMKTYRAVSKGLDTFEREHRLAPAVPQVRFRILMDTSKGKCYGYCNTSAAAVPGVSNQFYLRIVGDNITVPVPVTPDGYFTVPRSEALYEADADVILNQKKGAYRIKADVRTPGLPDNVRRLGDLRLECKVEVAIVKEEIPFWVVALANSVLLSRDWCMGKIGKETPDFNFFSPGTIDSATLTYGDRSEKVHTSEHSFKVRLADTSWPDDALVQLKYVAEEQPSKH